MDPGRTRVLDVWPYPVAYPYSLIFDESDVPSNRRWALCFTVYQLLRLVCLPLVSQYLRDAIDPNARDSVTALNRAIAAIRSPFFRDWITLAHTLRRHLTRVGITPLFPHLSHALEALKEREERPIGLSGDTVLDPLLAILALRNGTAHGGLPNQAEAAEHLQVYLPVLHQILEAFDFMGDTVLQVCTDTPEGVVTGRAQVRTLRGVQVGAAMPEDLADDLIAAFAESQAVVTGPDGRTVPLYPLFNPVTEQEPLFLYDGHYGIQVQTRQAREERSYIYYLGTHLRTTDSPACERLKELLQRRQISFFLSKEQTAPWTIADSAIDYSRRTLEELRGTKYFPECYLPFSDLEQHFERFVRVQSERWPAETSRRRYVNGLVLVGLAGAGKTAFLARQVETLAQQPGEAMGREHPNLVLLLRGNGIAPRPEGMSLFRDVAEKLGIAVEGATTRARSGGGFSSFRELLEHLHGRWKQDRLPERRLMLVLDALNEAPFAEQVIREALEMIGEAACYPWCKVVVSMRQEWLSLWSGKLGAQEKSPLEALRPFLYVTEEAQSRGTDAPGSTPDAGPPVVTLEPWSEAQVQAVYERYQAAARGIPDAEQGYRIPACQTPWSALPAATRELLTTPLYLHLFMLTFDGQPVEPVTTVSALFRRYVDTTLHEQPGLDKCVDAVMAHLLQDLTRPGADLSDDDCHAIRQSWAAAYTAQEARLMLSPVEGLAHEGMLTKRVREEGGGYRFVFQAVVEYLIYCSLADARPAGEAELAYWTRRAASASVFPEYAGAFTFLLRDWAAGERLAQVGSLVEAAPGWLSDVLTTFLIEQARTGYIPGRGSLAAERLATALAETGGAQAAYALHDAGCQQMYSRFALAARAYVQACVMLMEALYATNPEHSEIVYGLLRALTHLGHLLRVAGRGTDAEAAYRRAVEVGEALHATNPEYVEIGHSLMKVLTDLNSLLRVVGRDRDAEAAYRRAVEVGEAMGAFNPEHIEIVNGLGEALTHLGNLLRAAGAGTDAEAAYRRVVELSEVLYAANPEHIKIANGLGEALTHLGNLLRAAGAGTDAEAAYRRVVELSEVLYAANPEHIKIVNGLRRALLSLREPGWGTDVETIYRSAVEVGEVMDATCPEHSEIANGLLRALTHLGNSHRAAGRGTDAEAAYRRAVELSEVLYAANPEHIEIANGLAGALTNLGNLLKAKERGRDAEVAYRRAVEVGEALYATNPEHIEIANNLREALLNLGNSHRVVGRGRDAEVAYRRAVEVGEALYATNPEHIKIANNLREALLNLGNSHRVVGRGRDAEVAYRRAVEVGEALYATNPEHIKIANGLERALIILGNLHRASGQSRDAEVAYRRAVEVDEALYATNPDDVEIKIRYAGSLCCVGRFAEAGPLIDAALALIPEHPYANQVLLYMVREMALPPDTTKVTRAFTAHPRANPAEAARLEMQYQQDLADWQALSWWKRRRVPKPTPPAGI